MNAFDENTEILSTVEKNAISSFEDLVDLANERLGGAAILCSDDFFAGMDNLVKAKDPVFDPDAYGDRGKIMDGWESRRSHRENHASEDGGEHEDFCIVRLGAPGLIRGVIVDTAFFRGNYPSHCAVEGIAVDGYPRPQQIAARTDWVPVLPKVALEGNTRNTFAITDARALATRFTHVRLRIFPDGGVARLRVFGEPLPDWRQHGGLDGIFDLASAEVGGLVVACSDMFFGSRHNLLFPGNSSGMHDGWETRRARRPGSDWAVIRLGARGHAKRIVVDTSHFKGNCPESFSLEGTSQFEGAATAWMELFPRTELRPHTRHVFHAGIVDVPVTHVRLRVFPDGGVSRFRLFGSVEEAARGEERARRWNAMTDAEAADALRTCCGSSAWVKHMLAARPFGGSAGLGAAATRAFDALSSGDWLEAFRAHPRIGGQKPEGAATATSRALSSTEQARVVSATDSVKRALAEKNEAYFTKHGFIFIVKATGKSADEMLAILEERLQNDTAKELLNAAAEQRKITALRMDKIA